MLTFLQLRNANIARDALVFHHIDVWSPNDYAVALAGEVGELCNLLKKAKRGDVIDRQAFADELGDIASYLDVLATKMGFELEECIISKFDEVSAKKGCSLRLAGFRRDSRRGPSGVPTIPPA